ncbi:DNA recombination protein RmuC [Atopomonas sediminilitoris]|uniref:DNA recombination protein RmuC n=1 Tax=Atopomonas sediminilitoris TaxID=2919919 RepID=UPI001F4DFD3D|nr:DNA recombination protein RmuC [Atopomonas sediminilitoris]MCJ8168285.1 DNA recombination protein RmuC [Atopomonas sediminilitoris]
MPLQLPFEALLALCASGGLLLGLLVMAGFARRQQQAQAQAFAAQLSQAQQLSESLNQRLHQQEFALREAQLNANNEAKQQSQLRQQLEHSVRHVEQLQQRVVSSSEAAERYKAALEAAQQHSHEQRERLASQQQQLSECQQQLADLREAHATLNNTLEQRQQHFAEQQQLLKESREQLKLEFNQLATQIFEAKGQAFSQHSQQSLDALLKPFREQISGFRQKVEDIHHKDTQQQAELRNELQGLKALNQQITEEAHQLATALRGQKKMQGNWGELILENVLERSGLRAGIDYQREFSVTHSEGRSRPDAVVFLPKDKHLIIDAKVSLNAYTRYVNSEDEHERALALDEHVKAIGERIRELSDRHYYDLPGLNSPEMVFMFIPIESAFVEALRGDEQLFQKALQQNVLVATPTTLLTSLNIVRQLWRFEEQNKHTAELADKAAKVYDKLRTFLNSMDTVGKSLDKAQEAYQKACGQLVSGPGNLVKQVSEFRELGVSVKAELAEEWVEKGQLELTRSERDALLEDQSE